MKLLLTRGSILTAILITASLFSFAQLITTDPEFPTVDNAVTITFDATLGSGGLAGYQGDVYAHTGVITDESSSGSDWKYVKTDWGQNTPDTKLNRIDDDLYTLEITPSIKEYYGVPEGETILQMAFVFRSDEPVGGGYLEGKTATGGDIFVDVYEEGLNVSIIQPQEDVVFLELNEALVIEATANEADSIALYEDDILIQKIASNHLIDTLYALSEGKHWVKVVASTAEESVADSVYYFVKEEVVIQELPQGIRDGINYIDDNTVVLSLLAPYKEFVYVIGDFNNWQVESSYAMKMTSDGKHFWLEIGGLEAGTEYIFQYLIDGHIRIADPYTEKTSDPWNDKFISESVYPNLIDYPFGKTNGIAAVLQTAQEEYNWQVENFIAPAVEDLVIYEMLIRDFTTQHTYQSLLDTLGYLERLGVTAIELMPVNEFEGNSSWGYNPSFYFAPDKYYGPKNDLKAFIDACHEKGIAVLIDLVLNHSYDQSPFVQMYFDGDKPTTENPWYNREHNFTNPDAHWGNDFNHESLYTQQLVDSINSFWMNEYKVDGFRFDFTKGIGNNIKGDNDPWGSLYDPDRIALLKRMSDEIWERNPDAIVIFEHLAENSEEKELADYGILLWGNMNYNYSEGSMGYNSAGKSDLSGISYKVRNWNEPHLVGYMESHDEERVMYKNIKWGNVSGSYSIKDTTTALDRVALAACFFYPVPGPKMIWQFGELGYDYSINFNGRLGEKPVRWDYYQEPGRRYLHDVVAALIHLKRDHEVFKTEDFDLGVTGAMKRIQLNHPDMNVCIVGNFGMEENSMFPGFQHTGMWYDYFSGDSLDVTSLTETMALQAGEYHIYTDVKLAKPDITYGINIHNSDEPGILIYPNPAHNRVNILSDEVIDQIEIFNISGQLVYRSDFQNKSFEINTDNFPEGLYVIKTSGKSGISKGKLLINH